MAEAVTFWLDNKNASGIKVAEIGGQLLVSYRDRFYVVENGAARMRGSRPLHFSKSSLPAVWRKAMRGIQPPPAPDHLPENEILPLTTKTKKERVSMEKPAPLVDTAETAQGGDRPRQPDLQQPATHKQAVKPAKTARKSEPKPQPQTVVAAVCPYCRHGHDLPLEKGKNGKPFFVACAKCGQEFAVRFVPVTAYQAQVAAFR